MEVGWQLKEAVTKQFMTSFVQKSLEYFLYKPHNVIHTYIHHGSTYVFNVLKNSWSVWNASIYYVVDLDCYLLCTLTQ